MKKRCCDLSGGDTIYRTEEALWLEFSGPREVVGTNYFNGGYRTDLQAVFNHHSRGCCETLDRYLMEMRRLVEKRGYNPERVGGLSTGVSMDQAVIQEISREGIVMTALVTAGVKGNAGRAGDPAIHIPVVTNMINTGGTINIILHISAAAEPAVAMRAMVTATEAKSAALQEMDVGSCYSPGIATGTGTDQVVVITNPNASLRITDTGKHSVTGEMIGKIVKRAVRDAVYLHDDRDGVSLARSLAIMKRFKVTEELLREMYCQRYSAISMERFSKYLRRVERCNAVSGKAYLCACLLDRLAWDKIREKEALYLARKICSTSFSNRQEGGLKTVLAVWMTYYLDLVRKEVQNEV